MSAKIILSIILASLIGNPLACNYSSSHACIAFIKASALLWICFCFSYVPFVFGWLSDCRNNVHVCPGKELQSQSGCGGGGAALGSDGPALVPPVLQPAPRHQRGSSVHPNGCFGHAGLGTLENPAGATGPSTAPCAGRRLSACAGVLGSCQCVRDHPQFERIKLPIPV